MELNMQYFMSPLMQSHIAVTNLGFYFANR